jgi:hypothetical protein
MYFLNPVIINSIQKRWLPKENEDSFHPTRLFKSSSLEKFYELGLARD